MTNEHKSHIQSPEVLKKIGVSLASTLVISTMMLGAGASANEDTSESNAFPGMLDAVDPSEISIVSDQHAESTDEDASSEGSVEINRIGEEEDTPDSESEGTADVESDVDADMETEFESDMETEFESDDAAENTADVESGVESDVESDDTADVEANVESDIEADPNTVVNDEATVINGDESEGLPHTNGDAPQISLIASAMAFAMGAGLVLYSRRRQGQ